MIVFIDDDNRSYLLPIAGFAGLLKINKTQ